MPPSFESSGLGVADADVARDLRQLVSGDEDLVAVVVLELEVVAGDPGDRSGVEAGETGDAVVLVDDVLAGPRSPSDASRPRVGAGAVGAATVDEAAERDRP